MRRALRIIKIVILAVLEDALAGDRESVAAGRVGVHHACGEVRDDVWLSVLQSINLVSATVQLGSNVKASKSLGRISHECDGDIRLRE